MHVTDIAVVFLVLAAFWGVMTVQSRISQADKRVARVERKLDLVIDHLGLNGEDPRMGEVVSLVRTDRKIQAIKVYREITGADLKEAKEAVDRLG